MLEDGEKGVVIQRDKQTYAITPHLPCGLVTPMMLRKFADVAERFGATLKCTSAQRIAIIGLKQENVDAAWKELGGEKPAHMTGTVVRSIRACPGTQFCKRGWQDSLAVGLELDRKYHGRKLPGKMKIGVSGCPNQCAETSIKDIGMIGGAKGWTVVIGGACGMSARLAREITEGEIPTPQAMSLVDKLVRFFEKQGRPNERLGDVLGRMGMDKIRRAVGLA